MSGHASPEQRPGRITAGELARVCAQYDIGTVETVRKFRGGDRASPKVLLTTSTGRYLLKRRAVGQDDPYSVALAHHIINALLEAGFPAPPLVGTKRDNNSMLQMDGAVYEVFRFVEGDPYDRTPGATHEAGRVLALFHAALAPLSADLAARPGSPAGTRCYHAIADMPARIDAARRRINDPRLRSTFLRIASLYDASAERLRLAGFDAWPATLIHGDFHPGNLMYRSGRIVAALDFDTARRAPAVIDLANALLQFSITRTSADAARWPAAPDLDRFAALLAGYRPASTASRAIGTLFRRKARPAPAPTAALIDPAQLSCVPSLMVEALIAEAITPIALTGHFGSVCPASIIAMAARKAAWLDASADQLLNLLAARG